MAKYGATISWQRNGAVFTDKKFSRAHTWRFDGGAEVQASSSPHVVPLPLSDPASVDLEEAFVASLSSCHMLWFLSIACQGGFVVDSYQDSPAGLMARNNEGKIAMTLVTLRPKVAFSGDPIPDDSTFRSMHHAAHEACFIANSVKTEVSGSPLIVAQET